MCLPPPPCHRKQKPQHTPEGGTPKRGLKPGNILRQISHKPPVAPPPTIEKTAAPSQSYLEKIASEVLRKTLNFAPPPDRNVVALSQVSAKLDEVVKAQDAAEAQQKSPDAEGEGIAKMRKVPVVNVDLAAKLARRRMWEAEEEEKKKAAKAAQQLHEQEMMAQMLQGEREAQQREEREAQQREKEQRLAQLHREAEREKAAQRAREREIQKEIEMKMERSMEMQRVAKEAQTAEEERMLQERSLQIARAEAQAQEDEEMEDLVAARKAAEAAAQLAALERAEIERKISAREQEKDRLRQERLRLEGEVRRAAAEAEHQEQMRQSRTESIRASLSNDKRQTLTSSRPSPSSDILVPPLRSSDVFADRQKMDAALTKYEAEKAVAAVAAKASAAAREVTQEEVRVLKVDGRLSDILSGIDKLLKGETIVQKTEKKLQGIIPDCRLVCVAHAHICTFINTHTYRNVSCSSCLNVCCAHAH
jgi:hypothetical protein